MTRVLTTLRGPHAAKGATPPCIFEVCTDERRNSSGRSATPHRPTGTDDCQSRGHERCSTEPDDECGRGHRDGVLAMSEDSDVLGSGHRRLSWMCGGRGGFCSAPWSRSSTLCLWSRCSTTLCRRRRNSWWKCRRLLSYSSLQQLIVEQTVDIPVRGRAGGGGVEVLKVSLDRIQQRFWSRSC